MKGMKSLAALAALALAFSGCSGGHAGGTLPATPALTGTGSASDSFTVKNWSHGALNGAAYVGPSSGAHLNAMVLVHQRNSNGLLEYSWEVNDPSSPNFRHFLTPQEIGDRFGASQADYQKVAQYFANNGLAVGGWPQRMILSVAGSQANFERAIGTKFGVFSKSGQRFIAPTGTPRFTQALPVDSIGRVATYMPMHKYLMPGTPHAGLANSTGFTPPQVRNAFDYTGAYQAGYNGAGITVGIIGTGPIDSETSGSGDYDLDGLASKTNSNVAHVTQVNVSPAGVAAGLGASGIPTAPPATPNPNGTPAPVQGGFPYSSGFQSPPPVTPPCQGSLPDCNPEDGEAQLDVQQVATLAPGANVNFYLAYNANDCFTYYPNPCAPGNSVNSGIPLIGLPEADAEIQQVIGDNVADIISMSYGGGESQTFSGLTDYNTSYYSLQFAALAAEGIAAFASSGDSGSTECLDGQGGYLGQPCVSYPSGDNNVTSVGGVTAPIDAFGTLQAPMVAWGISTGETGYGGFSGSGGGTSVFMNAPSWQQSALSATKREQPDVSLIGDPSTGVAVMGDARWGGVLADFGGTSIAAPQMAAMWALVLSACRQNPGQGMCPVSGSGSHWWRLGNASPYMYALYKGTKIRNIAPAQTYAQTFYDVLYGSNEMADPINNQVEPIPGAAAMTGYDQVTGVGVPYARHLIKAITGI